MGRGRLGSFSIPSSYWVSLLTLRHASRWQCGYLSQRILPVDGAYFRVSSANAVTVAVPAVTVAVPAVAVAVHNLVDLQNQLNSTY